MSARLAFTATSRQPPRLSRQWLLAALRTFLWVVVITVLIWVYADLQMTEQKNISASLRVHAGSSTNLVLLKPDEAVNLNFRIKGNRYAIDTLMNRLAKAGWQLDFDVAGKLGPGRHRELTAELLGGLPEIGPGLQVLSASPRDLEIQLDELRPLKAIPVDVDVVGGEAEDLKLEPQRVDLLVPATEMGRLDPERLRLKTRAVDLGRYDVGTEVKDLPVEVLPPTDIQGVRLVSPTLRASFKVGWQAYKDYTVRVNVNMPESWTSDGTWEKYRLEIKLPEPWTRRIKVLGQRIDLDRLKQEDIQAYVELVEAAKDIKSWEFGQVRVILPSELKVRLSPEPIAPVGYRLAPRAATSAGG